jgi:hypothetical protein
MRITLYIIASLTLIAIVGGFVYSTISPADYQTTIYGQSFNFPIAVWITIPMFILLVSSVLHMMYYGFKNHLKLKRWTKDTDTLKDALYWSILKEPKKKKYLKNDMKKCASILNISNIEVNGSAEGLDDKFVGVLDIVKDINLGKYIDLKEKKLKKILSNDNPLVVQNNINRLKVSPEYIEEILRSKEVHSDKVVSEAVSLFIKTASFSDALKYVKLLTIKDFYLMLDRVDSGEKMNFEKDILDKFVAAFKFECEDYMRLSLTTLNKFTPTDNIGLFNKYRKNTEKAENAYLCILFDYERIEYIEEFLEEQRDDEFKRYRALLALRNSNYHFKLEDFIDKQTVCNAH